MLKKQRIVSEIVSNDAALSAFISFIQTARAVVKYTDNHLYKSARFSMAKLIVLQALSHNNGVMKPSEIAEWTQTERHNITALVDRLKREGLVKIERDTSDKRTVNVIMTQKGRERLSQAMPVAKKVVDQVMLLINESDAAQLENILSILRRNADRGLRNLTEHSK
jgi:DNA-binding MarR family transcriptional regulator